MDSDPQADSTGWRAASVPDHMWEPDPNLLTPPAPEPQPREQSSPFASSLCCTPGQAKVSGHR